MKPLLHRVYVQPDKVEDSDDLLKRAKAAGIHLEMDKREQKASVSGVVVAIGSTAYKEFGTTAEEQGVVVGSRVLYAKYAGAAIPNSEMIILNDEDCLAVLGEDE
jgi:co-chaperonin GroES (HSP10)